MKSTSTKQLAKRIATGSLIFYVFSGLSSLLNYAFYPTISRFVSVSEYGEIQFLVSTFTQFAVGFVVLNILAIIIGTEIKDQKQQKNTLAALNLVSSLVVILISIFGSSLLFTQREAFTLTSNGAIVALGLSLLINVPFTIAIGKLQGNGQFIASGVVSVLGAFFKLIFSVLFIILGFGVAGAILGIFVGMAVSLAIVELVALKSKSTHKPSRLLKRRSIVTLKFIQNRAIVALVAITFITLLSAADSITSRIVLNSVEAGHYAAVATVSKMILAASSPLMWLALPPAIRGNHTLVLRYIGLTLAIGICALIIFSLTPVFFTSVIIGVDAQDFLSLLPFASIAMIACSTAFIVLTVTICLGHLRRVVFATILASISYVAIISLSITSDIPLVTSILGQLVCSSILIVVLSPCILNGKFKNQDIVY